MRPCTTTNLVQKTSHCRKRRAWRTEKSDWRIHPPPKSELLDDKGLEVNDKEELLGPLPKSEETDALQPGQWEQHESGKDIEEPETWQQLVMGAGKARLQEPLEEPPPEKSEASRACKGRNKIPPNACYQSSLRTSEQGQGQIWTLNVVWDMGRYQ